MWAQHPGWRVHRRPGGAGQGAAGSAALPGDEAALGLVAITAEKPAGK